MFTEDKITEIFYMADDFCQFFDAMMEKYTLKEAKKRKYHRDGTLSNLYNSEDQRDRFSFIWRLKQNLSLCSLALSVILCPYAI